MGRFCFCINTCPLSSLCSEVLFQAGPWDQQFQLPLNPERCGGLFTHFIDEKMEAHRAQATCLSVLEILDSKMGTGEERETQRERETKERGGARETRLGAR